MSVRRLAPEQPDGFEFTPESLDWAKKQIAKYPSGKEVSAIIPLLWQAQKQNKNWLSEPAMRYVGDMLGMAYIRVYEVATFYTMFNLGPVGEHYVQLCGTTPCWLRGADDLKAVCEKHIGIKGSTSNDGMLTWIEVECLGACVNAPMVQINDDYYEDLDAESFERIVTDLREGRTPKTGSARGRASSEPEQGLTTLLDERIYDTAVAARPFTLTKDDAAEGGKESG